MCNTKYNGWTNYETWRVNLEICDDLVSSMIEDERKFDSVGELADYLSEAVDDVLTGYGEVETGLALNYARAFVSEVNWYEIAELNADELVVPVVHSFTSRVQAEEFAKGK